MATLNSQTLTGAGIAPTFAAASAGGDKIQPGEGVYLHVKNGGASPIDVTIDAKQPCSLGFDHDNVVTVPAGGEREILVPEVPYKGSDGLADIAYSAVTTVTVGAFRTP